MNGSIEAGRCVRLGGLWLPGLCVREDWGPGRDLLPSVVSGLSWQAGRRLQVAVGSGAAQLTLGRGGGEQECAGGWHWLLTADSLLAAELGGDGKVLF